MSELKPCPFCGGEARTARDATGFLQWVYCPECGGQTGYFTGNADGIKKLVIDAWNTRVNRTCRPIEHVCETLPGTDCPAWECSECGELFEEGARYCSQCGAKVVD